MSQNIIKIEDLSYSYERQKVLNDINLLVKKGDFLGLVGPNGSGKSTLLKCILGIQQPDQGKIELFGTDIRKMKSWQKIGYVSQKANSFNSGFPASVFEVVSLGLVSKIGLFNGFKNSHKKKVTEALKAVGMNEFANRNIGELSGGQQQRVFIARALVSDPELLILDEPTVGVDAENVESFYQLLSDLNSKLGITLLLVSHDIGIITDKVSHVACLNKKLHFHGSRENFKDATEKDLSLLYGHSVNFLSHNHELDDRGDRA
jgi:zinc transport system ATP-binding protein